MAGIPNNKIKIGVHWKNFLSVDISSTTHSPRHPKLIELDPVCILLDLLKYFSLYLISEGHSTE